MKLTACLFSSRAPAATILIRLMVGAVFFSEGIQKFLFPDALGAGRFVKIGRKKGREFDVVWMQKMV